MTKILDILMLLMLFLLPSLPVTNAEVKTEMEHLQPVTKFMIKQLNEQADSIIIKLDSANKNMSRLLNNVNNNS